MNRNQWDLLNWDTEKLGVSKAGVPELQEEIEQPLAHFSKSGKPCWIGIRNGGLNALQQPTQNICPGDNAFFLLPPYENHISVYNIIPDAMHAFLESTQDVAQKLVWVFYNYRPVAVS